MILGNPTESSLPPILTHTTKIAIMKRNTHDLTICLSLVVLSTCMLLPGTTAAQALRSIDVFGGYSHIQVDPGIEGVESFGTNGFHVEATRFLTRKFGIAAELSGLYGSTATDLENIDEVTISQHGFLVGPRLNSLGFWRINLSTRALIGFSTLEVDAEVSSEDFPRINSVEGTETDVAIALGASIDLSLSERISLRLIQSNFFFTFFGDDSQTNNRYSTGLLVRF